MRKEMFFDGNDLDRAERAARLLHAVTKKPVYVSEDFCEPWGFFVGTTEPMHSGSIYAVVGRACLGC